MGMYIKGNNPNSKFESDIWSWRTVLSLCQRASDESHLGIDFNRWPGYAGVGLKSPQECEVVADALSKSMETIPVLPDGEIYINLGYWVTPEGAFSVYDDTEDLLNRTFKRGQIMEFYVEVDGKLYCPVHSCSVDTLNNFINFLRESGGFEIR